MGPFSICLPLREEGRASCGTGAPSWVSCPAPRLGMVLLAPPPCSWALVALRTRQAPASSGLRVVVASYTHHALLASPPPALAPESPLRVPDHLQKDACLLLTWTPPASCTLCPASSFAQLPTGYCLRCCFLRVLCPLSPVLSPEKVTPQRQKSFVFLQPQMHLAQSQHFI